MNIYTFKQAETIVKKINMFQRIIDDLKNGVQPSILLGPSNYVLCNDFNVLLIDFCNKQITELNKQLESL